MESRMRLDHIVIVVSDLHAGIRDYTELGFQVVPGGQHGEAPSHNALIGFQDESYIELIAFQGEVDSSPGGFARLLRMWQEKGEGLVDFALVPVNLEQDLARIQSHNISIQGPFPGSRTRPDGEQISWQLGIPETLDLPFFCDDVTPRSLRIPEPSTWQHPNGVRGVAGIVIAVEDLDKAVERYSVMLNQTADQLHPSPVPEAKTADFQLGPSIITLAAPDGDSHTLRTHLSKRGEGIYYLMLQTEELSTNQILDPYLTHQAYLELIAKQPVKAG